MEVTITGRETPFQLVHHPALTTEEISSTLDYWINNMLHDAFPQEYDKPLQPQQICKSNPGEFHPSIQFSRS